MSAQAYSMQSDMCVMHCTLNSHNDRITIILTTSPQVIVIPWLQGFIVENHPKLEGAAQGRGHSFGMINP